MKIKCLLLGYLLSVFSVCCQGQETTPATNPPATGSSTEKSDMPDSEEKEKKPPALSFTVDTIEGEKVDLSKYHGQVVIIVNTASRCGMTPQYKDLQVLHTEFADKGVAVLGFPCNQFGRQEPGTESEISEFCTKNYGVTFDMFAKVDVNGEEASDLFKHLTEIDAKPAGSGDVKWNFEKFVLDKSGNLIARFGSRVKPSSDEFMQVIRDAVEK